MLALLFGTGLLLMGQAGGAAQKPNATIERLRTAGVNSIVVEACALVGYTGNSDAMDRYVEQELGIAYAAGMPIATAQSYMDAGMQRRGTAIKAELARQNRLIDAKDKSADVATRKFVADLVTDCDALASRPETRAMFESTPSDTNAARAAGYKRFGLEVEEGK
jgi:hypothetical protein